MKHIVCFLLFAIAASLLPPQSCAAEQPNIERPNILFILTDDHRHDCLSSAGNELARTPHLDQISARGVQFKNSFVTLAICSPSRAACLTGQYGSVNGVTAVGRHSLHDGAATFATALGDAGYATGVTGKWHLKEKPVDCGFQFASTCWSNGTWYDRQFTVGGKKKIMPGFVDDVTADESIRFMKQATSQDKPFVLWMNTQVPHMDHRFNWPAKDVFRDKYDAKKMPLPATWNDELDGKPEYLQAARNRSQALKYGYDDPANIREHARDYYASVEQMDAAVGRVLSEIDRLNIRDNTWIIFMGDNGWFLGEHGLTSKVLPYEESMRVPMAIAGPTTKTHTVNDIVLNIDLTATILDLAGLTIPRSVQGRSLLPLIDQKTPDDWRKSFLYEAPTSQLGSKPLWSVRDAKWKYVQTELENNTVFEELYDLQSDAIERSNVADQPANRQVMERLRQDLVRQRSDIESAAKHPANDLASNRSSTEATRTKEPTLRTDLFISGVYPHLTTYGVYSQNGAHNKSGHNECGIGAIVPWAGKLWMVNYAPHMPRGSEHKLFSVDPDLSQPMTIHPESVGGTPAGRMLHKESGQLLIAHYAIDAQGTVRAIQPKDMPIRVTAIARHLTDPANMVYYIDMEGSIWEANVHTLAVKRLFKKPVPGWHSKGGYTSQGRLVVSNNGELHVGDYSDVLVGGKAKTDEERGVLAQWDGSEWQIIERRQFTEVTGPAGITGGSDGDDPIWSMGWDRRSVRFKLLENGKWHTYLLPKAAYCNDASHGWYTEWPRIRQITGDRWMMDMHGMFFDFPKTFSTQNSKGLRPIGSHLRYIPDFCDWNGRLVLATDETSIQGNELAGQPQSNLWFGDYDDLKTWGPANGYGGPWIDDPVKANEWSDPFLVAGFDQRCLHLAVGLTKPAVAKNAMRATDQQRITSMPDALATLPRVTIARGNWRKPAPGFAFEVDQSVTVFLAVDRRGSPNLGPQWKPTDLELRWGKNHRDQIYSRQFDAGTITIPANPTEHTKGSFGMPHTAFVQSLGTQKAKLQIQPDERATVSQPMPKPKSIATSPVNVAIQIDVDGTNEWTDYQNVTVDPNRAKSIVFPRDLDATWMRFSTDQDCIATAFLHQTSQYPNHHSSQAPIDHAKATALFQGLADLEDQQAIGGLVYAAKRNRHLRIVAPDDHGYEFSKDQFQFKTDSADKKLAALLKVEPEFTVDDASVIVQYQGKRLRLPKGHSAYDKPFASGWPRALREVQSERTLANIHGTFYEVPLVTNGAPPAWNQIRPVSSHRKQIVDFCSWNGLLVLSGIKPNAVSDGHVFRDPTLETGLWLGGVDDLWQLGKPVGQGGPWKNTTVKAGVPSDAYLMTGYETKTASMSHNSPGSLPIKLQVDIDGQGRWIDYQTFDCPTGEVISHEFPEGFSASWVRGICDQQATVTLQFDYR